MSIVMTTVRTGVVGRRGGQMKASHGWNPEAEVGCEAAKWGDDADCHDDDYSVVIVVVKTTGD